MTGPSSGDRPAEETCTCGIPMQHTASCPAHQREACPFCALPGTVPITEHHRTAPWRPATPPAVRTGDDAATEQRERELVARVVEALGHRGLAADFRAGRQNLPLIEQSTPPPVSGTATRDDVARELRRHSASARLVDNGSTYITCRCGHAIGSYFHGWGDPASHEAWELHRADALLALGGSQPATQPAEERLRQYAADAIEELAEQRVWTTEHDNEVVSARDLYERVALLRGELEPVSYDFPPDRDQPVQPAEEQRPIDLLTEHWDAGRAWVQLPAEDVAFIRGFDPDRDRTASRADMVRVVEHLQAALGDGGDRG